MLSVCTKTLSACTKTLSARRVNPIYIYRGMEQTETFLNSSKTPKDNEMKFSHLNFTPLRVIFTYINKTRCAKLLPWQTFVSIVSHHCLDSEKLKETWLIFLVMARSYLNLVDDCIFTLQFQIRKAILCVMSFWRQSDKPTMYLTMGVRRSLWRDFLFKTFENFHMESSYKALCLCKV